MEFKTSAPDYNARPVIEKDIRSVVTLITVQCMIHLGQIPDPLSGQTQVNLNSADLFFGLLEILEEKTCGNLNVIEQSFLEDVMANLRKIRKKKG